jgi:hypothetical protein
MWLVNPLTQSYEPSEGGAHPWAIVYQPIVDEHGHVRDYRLMIYDQRGELLSFLAPYSQD